MFEAYFVHDRNIGSPAVLAELAGEIGLPGDELRAALADGRYLPQVRAEYQEARELGITAVPTFIAGDYALVGAHPYENFEKLMAAAGAQPIAQHL